MVGRNAGALLFLLLFAPTCSLDAADAAASRAPARRPITPPVKVLRYAQRIVEKYDTNGDGKLQASEWEGMSGNPRVIDRDRDEVISAQELAEYVARYGYRRRIRLMPAATEGKIRYPSLLSPDAIPNNRKKPGLAKDSMDKAGQPATTGAASAKSPTRAKRGSQKFTVPRSRLPKGLPSWFLVRDRDGDTQLTLAEYAPDGSQLALREFTRYDANGDGVVTAQECLRNPRAKVVAGTKPDDFEEPDEEQPAEDMEEGSIDEPPSDDAEARRLKKERLREERLKNKKNSQKGKGS